MSTTTKSVLVIVVLAALALVAVYAFQGKAPALPENTGAALPSGADTSDAGLGEDAAAIDASLSELDSEQAEVDAGLTGHVAP